MTTLAELRADYDDLRQRSKNGEPWLRLRAGEAYNRWFHQSCVEGRPPDSLERSSPIESERFFARVIQGVDGHCYWQGERQFRKNDGRSRAAHLWWWEYHHGPLAARSVVKPVCGEPHCITPEHQQLVPWSEYRRLFSDEQCIGGLQVAAMRLGHSPTMDQYAAMRIRPSAHSIATRFSSWRRALKAAGLPEPPLTTVYVQLWSSEDCLVALRAAHETTSVVPKTEWWDRTGQVPSRRTILRRWGSWLNALRAAGLKP